MDPRPSVALWPLDDFAHDKALCIEFANTLSWRGRPNPDELLPDPDAWLSWLEANGALSPPILAVLRARMAAHPEEAAAALARALDLRESIYTLLSDNSKGVSPGANALMTLQDVLSRAFSNLRFENREGGWRFELDLSATWEAALFAPALSAAQLLASPYAKNVRPCGRDECRWLFLDLTKNHSRKWCDMSSCGNVVKARTRYARQKAQSESSLDRRQ